MHAISDHPLLARHIKKIREPSLIYLEKLNSSSEDDIVQLQFKVRDLGCALLFLKAGSALSTAAYRYKLTYVWRSCKAEVQFGELH